MQVSRPKFLELTRRLALLTTVALPLAACASSTSNTGGGTSPPAPTTSTTSTKLADQPDPTVGTGPCRCSWDTNQSAAPRVCKKGQVHDVGAAYVCDQTPTCKFRTGKVILQREIPAEQVKKLLETGKTDLIPKFISKKNRPFSAYLKLDGAKVGFEFEPRKAAPKKAPAGKPPVAEAA